jgi:molybdate transport system substrate-binding protein
LIRKPAIAKIRSMPPPLTAISSKATQSLLAELLRAYQARSGQGVAIESVGGVDAARRVQAGEAFDLVFLASDAIDRLIASGHVHAGTRVDLVRSPVAVAVRAGAPRPDIGSAAALRQAVLDAPSLGCSTGPSGAHLAALFERWGIADVVQPRTRLAPPGVPVGSLVAGGQVALGFQQLSELLHQPGIEVVGTLPAEVACITTFSAGLSATLDLGSARAEAARALLAFLRSDAAADAKRRHGMEPA